MRFFAKFLVFMLLLAPAAQARQGRPMQRIHAAKMAYITDRLQLTEDQAAHFMPIYKEYEHDLREVRLPYIKKYKLNAGDDDRETSARQYVEDDLDYQQEVIALKRRYNDQFLKVLTPQQLADMYVAEREFRRILMKRLEDRRRGDMDRRR